MLVKDLQGAELDYWVAKAEGVPFIKEKYRESDAFHASWVKGGPIIETEKIGLDPSPENDAGEMLWAAEIYLESEEPMGKVVLAYGSTPLIAAMRAYVASKFGDTVDD